jgi:hypothetical protein
MACSDSPPIYKKYGLRFFAPILLSVFVILVSTPRAYALLPTTTTVVSSNNPSAFGSTVTFTATVSGVIVTPTGTVTFKDGATTLGTAPLNSGSAGFTITTLSTGSHSITAVYGGDTLYNGSTSTALIQSVVSSSTATAVTSSANPSALEQSVIFTATVTITGGGGGTPTGTVTFLDGTTTLGTSSLDGSGHATFSTSVLTPGNHSITANYSGDTNFSASSSPTLTQTVNLGTSSTAVTSSANPSSFGQSVTFTATVSGLIIQPTGTVTFMDGATTLGTGNLNASGQASFTTTTLAVGSHPITAVYGGNSFYNSSTSNLLIQTISQSASSTAVVSSSNPAALGTSVTFTATVTGTGATPTGTVTFMDGATTLGSGTLNGSGQATFSTSSLTVGAHPITTIYGGNTDYAGSTSPVLTQTITANSSSTALASSANPSTFGQSVTFTATVSGTGGTPTGTVIFKDGATTLGSGTLSAGQATFSTSTLATGSHSITAAYSGDSNFSSSTSPVLTQTVNQTSSTTAIASSANPSAYGTAVTFTATVSGTGGTPTGTVTFKDGATTLGTGTVDGAGQATLQTSALTPGSHSITAAYGGDLNFTASTSPVLTQTVNLGASATAVASSANPSALGASVTFTATVSGTGAAPTGTVTFKDGATTLGSGTLSGGQATFSTSALAVGSHAITAVYGGDSNYSGSTSSVLTQTVTANGSTTAVASSLNPSSFGQSVTFTATVSGSGGTPTGSVTFKDGATTLGTAALNGSGQATFSTTMLTAGSHAITAAYSGDSNFGSSVSPVLTQTVNATSTTIGVTSSVNPSAFGQSVTFTATVSGTGGTPTGSVTFKDGATTLGTGTLNGGGQATFSISSLAVGSHPITAVYGGDVNYSGSTSTTLTQNVNANASATAIASSVNPSAFGQAVTFTATVTGPGGTPTGTVTFKDGNTTLGNTTLNGSGQAAFSANALTAGSHSITAAYGGDGNFDSSVSPALTQTVNQTSSTTGVTSSVNPSAFGQSVTFTATVSGSGGTPTGTVTFKDGATMLGTGTLNGSSQATFSTGALTTGSHSITAAYSGDGNFGSNVSAVLTQTVNQNASTTGVASSVNPSAFGQSVTFTATVSGTGGTPTGTVTFKDGATTLGSAALNGSGQASFSTTALTAGGHSITASYSGDTNFGSGTSPVLTQTVNQTSSTIGIASSVDPSAFGQSVTFTATINGSGGTPTGSVTFKDGATTLGSGTLSGGQATFSTSALVVGAHSITAVYGGDANFSGSTSATLTQTVTANSTATAIASSVDPSVAGQSVTFTATVTGAGGTPTGTVAFKDGATTIGTVALNGSGQAAFSTATLATGGHSITAAYSGDSNFGTSTSPVLTQTVNQTSSTTGVASSADPSAFGQAVTFTATVNGAGGMPTGSVTFKDGSTTIGTGTLSGGQAAFSTLSLIVGAHSITAAYGGDPNYSGSTSPALTQTVTANTSTTAISSSIDPSTFGQSVTFTATVTGAGGTPTGTVTFKDGTTTLGTAAVNGSGQAAFPTTALTTGGHAITAAYSGDTNFGSSVSPALTQTVNQTTSTASVASSTNPSAFGQSVTFTATVSGSGGTPTGSVIFKDGATTLGNGTLSGGQATLATGALAVGGHSITVVYGGDLNYSGSTSAALTQTVTTNSSTTAVASSINPSTFGQSATFTATVTGSGGTPTGSVTFKDGTATLGTASLNGSGQATFSTAALTTGGHSITAAYGGDTNFGSSTSPVLTQTVNAANSSGTSITSSANPSSLGAPVTFTAVVSGAGGTPTGTVTFKDGATTLGSGTLNGSGQGTFSTNSLSVGAHSITANYGGDNNFPASTSPVLTQTINQNASAVALVSSANPSALTQSVTFTATVTGSGGTPTGTVTFKDGATTLGSGTLSGGQATFSTSTLAAGANTITAAYGGDSNFGSSVSPVLTQTVNAANSSGTSLTSSADPSSFGAMVTFTAVVSGNGGTPTGFVTFRDGATILGSTTLNGSGQTTMSMNSLAVGPHPITANYVGDNNFSASLSPMLTQTVNQNAAAIALKSSLNPSSFGQAVTFTATVTGSGGTPTGTVIFKDGGTVVGTATLTGPAASVTTSSLSIGTHSIVAIYGGDGNFTAATSAALSQAVNTPPDSIRLRNLQVIASQVAAQGSGQAISGSIESAIADGFSERCTPLVPSPAGIHVTVCPERDSTKKVNGEFAALNDAPLQQRWLLWADIRAMQLTTTGATNSLTGTQVNGLTGLTYRFTPDVLVGALAGYEFFDYSSESLDGRLQGQGWTAGGYFGWRFLPGVRFEGGLTRSGIDFNGVAGTASGIFGGGRTLATAAIVGTYNVTKTIEIDPSVRVYDLWEQEKAYIDSLGTAQAERTFSTGRASTGVKAIFSWQATDNVTLLPYVGLYADYYFSNDSAVSSPQPSTPLLAGLSARLASGLTMKTVYGAQFTLGGELGGIGGAFTMWTFRTGAMVPF